MSTNVNGANSRSSNEDEYYPQQQQQTNQPIEGYQSQAHNGEAEEIVQVVYQSNQNGSQVDIESSLLNTSLPYQHNTDNNNDVMIESASVGQQQHRSSTLPSVAEESTCGNNNNIDSGAGAASDSYLMNQNDCQLLATEQTSFLVGAESNHTPFTHHHHEVDNNTTINYEDNKQQYPLTTIASSNLSYEEQHYAPDVIYSTINKKQNKNTQSSQNADYYAENQQYNNISLDDSIGSPTTTTTTSFYTANNCSYQQQANNPQADIGQQLPTTDSADNSNATLQNKHSPIKELLEEEEENDQVYLENKELINNDENKSENLIELYQPLNNVENVQDSSNDVDEKENNDDFQKLLTRSKGGAAESGSFRHNFRKKLAVSVSTNENDLIAHRQKLLEVKEATTRTVDVKGDDEDEDIKDLNPKFKRTHSVSFNVGSNRSGRHSVDIRNLPSYLTVKRASIVDVAKGAMSSLMHSLGASGGGASGSVISRRDSSPDDALDEEPIFEEPIAPTLSLGQRVALVKQSGAEFGTVGWIGQLPDVDDDWIVGVIFDNMIGNCDGEYNGVRYFYSRENYAMFVPLSALTKTDNYIGRPETGTMLSRMSVSLKPGQLISIHRSSIRLQHCFLNAPHQRVGHDVRAVSNRLHCQCHNCGPCAHLTKQGRIPATPLFGTHHAPNKKNSLAHAAVEILAHHHHHYHEEEHHEEDYQFGDNAAHACNFVRYSCCQQSGIDGHSFSADCQMVRPELLDNLIHAPRAPHRRSRPRRSKYNNKYRAQQQNNNSNCLPSNMQSNTITNQVNTQQNNLLNIDANYNYDSTIKTASSLAKSELDEAASSSSYSSCSSKSSRSSSPTNDGRHSAGMFGINHNFDQMSGYQYNTYNQTTNNNAYSTIDTQMSILDQQRFIFRKESSTLRSKYSNTSDDYNQEEQQSLGFGSSIRRCFACLIGRKNATTKSSKKHKRPKKRKLSARNRIIEYRRRQSTFVPSTLAKPHEDFASHGIILPQSNQILINQQSNKSGLDSNSDYSSYSRSSNSSSRSQSPDNNNSYQQQQQQLEQNFNSDIYQNQRQTMTLEHEIPQGFNEQQLKSCSNKTKYTYNDKPADLNYDDYTFSDGGYSSSLKKDNYKNESGATDMGYYDSMASYSNDTLKQIVDQAINEVEPLDNNEIIEGLNSNIELISPLLSIEENNNNQDVLEISSPTISTVDLEDYGEFGDRDDNDNVCDRINSLNLNDKRDEC